MRISSSFSNSCNIHSLRLDANLEKKNASYNWAFVSHSLLSHLLSPTVSLAFLMSPDTCTIPVYFFTLSKTHRSSPSWFLKCSAHVAQFVCYFINTFQFCRPHSLGGGGHFLLWSIRGGSARKGWLFLACSIVKGWKNRYLSILSILRVSKVRVKKTAAKFNYIKSCQILAKITQDTRTLRAFSKGFRATESPDTNVAYKTLLLIAWILVPVIRTWTPSHVFHTNLLTVAVLSSCPKWMWSWSPSCGELTEASWLLAFTQSVSSLDWNLQDLCDSVLFLWPMCWRTNTRQLFMEVFLMQFFWSFFVLENAVWSNESRIDKDIQKASSFSYIGIIFWIE